MRAHLGDQLVIDNPTTGAVRRDGEIVGLHHDDGTPPYDVRWSDTDEVTLVFPGPGAHIHHPRHAQPATARGRSRTNTHEAQDASAVSETLPPTLGPGDIGRRVADERRRRGLSREDTARRAGMSPQHLAYLEEQPADPSVAGVIRLADALGTSVSALRGAAADLPPGQGAALLHPRMRDLRPKECRALLATQGVGRITVSAPDGHPAVVPVDYEIIDDAIVFRTAPGAVPAAAVGKDVAFEVDRVDEACRQGWSVLVVGPASRVTRPETVRRLTRRAATRPWAGGERQMWVSIRPTRLTGRRITSTDE